MTGPEHYKESERLLDESVKLMERHASRAESMQAEQAIMQAGSNVVAMAQVHATLALAASQLRSLSAEATS